MLTLSQGFFNFLCSTRMQVHKKVGGVIPCHRTSFSVYKMGGLAVRDQSLLRDTLGISQQGASNYIVEHLSFLGFILLFFFFFPLFKISFSLSIAPFSLLYCYYILFQLLKCFYLNLGAWQFSPLHSPPHPTTGAHSERVTAWLLSGFEEPALNPNTASAGAGGIQVSFLWEGNRSSDCQRNVPRPQLWVLLKRRMNFCQE